MAIRGWDENLFRNIDELELSVRAVDCLKNANIFIIGELVQKSDSELLKIKNCSRSSLNEVKTQLAMMGLGLGMELKGWPSEAKHAKKSQELVAIALFDGKIRLVSLAKDGRYAFLDETQAIHKLLYIVSPETLALKRAVEELESLINDPNTREKDLQEFFERNPKFILNDEYKKAHPKLVLEKAERRSLIPDFVLEPYDQNRLCDLLDLKTPFAKVFVLRKSRMRFSAAVLEVCAQLREYHNFFENEENRIKVFEKYGLLAYKPKMFVIIGRRGKVNPIDRRRIEMDLSQISVRTYDDIIVRIKEKIKTMERGEKRSVPEYLK